MRILLIANNIMELGGAQRVVHQLADGLAGRGHDVTAIGVVPHARAHWPAADGYASITLLDRAYPKVGAERARLERDAVQRLQAVLDDGEPGIVISAQLWAMEHLARCRLGDWRVIGQYHSSFEAAANGRDLERAQRVYAEVDAFTLLCDADTAAFAARGFTNVLTMPNAVAFRSAAPATLVEPVITYLGRLSKEKGPRFLVEAWRRLAGEHPAWRLRFVGGGPLEQALAAEADGVPRLSFEPPTDDPMAVLSSSSVLALPSLTEGFPLAVAEAMSCGVPCVASDCSSGVRDLVTDGVNGLIARRGDAGHLAEQLGRLIEDAGLRRQLGAAAWESTARLQAALILDRWERLFADVQR